MEVTPSRNNTILIFLGITALLSSLFYAVIIYTGHIGGGNGMYVMGLMWSPGLSALLTLKIQRRSLSDLGWSWGESRYQWMSYSIPLLYSAMAYVLVWMSGYGGFYDADRVNQITESFGLGPLPAFAAILLYVILLGVFGIISGASHALGEEIGWRGLLVPELYKKYGYVTTSLVTGFIWSAWHYPILLFADYNSGTPAWFGLTCFTVMVVSSCFIYTWLRMKSGSLWTGVWLHASHNLFIQAVFTPLTFDTGSTKYVIDEFGIAVPAISILFGFYFWTRRAELSKS